MGISGDLSEEIPLSTIPVHTFYFRAVLRKRPDNFCNLDGSRGVFYFDVAVGFSTRELNKLDVLVSENEEHILKEWGEFHG